MFIVRKSHVLHQISYKLHVRFGFGFGCKNVVPNNHTADSAFFLIFAQINKK